MNADRAIELQEQAWRLQAEGKLDEALRAAGEALRLMEECDGSDSPDAANLLNDLAEIEIERQSFGAALALAERARAIEDALQQIFTGETATRIRTRTLSMLGAIRRMRGDYPAGETDLQQALSLAEREFGQGSEEVAEARNNLAVLYKDWGRFDEGLRLYRKALEAVVTLHGENCIAAATLLHNIGGILHSMGDFAAAATPGRKAWDISRRLLGEDDPQTMLDAAAYAAILDGLGQYDESEPIYCRAVEIFENVFGPGHYEVAANLHNLAAVRAVRGATAEAEEHYRRALAIKEQLLGEDSPDAALTRMNLGSLLNAAGRCREAALLLESAVAVLEKRLAPGHPHLTAARKCLQTAR